MRRWGEIPGMAILQLEYSPEEYETRTDLDPPPHHPEPARRAADAPVRDSPLDALSLPGPGGQGHRRLLVPCRRAAAPWGSDPPPGDRAGRSSPGAHHLRHHRRGPGPPPRDARAPARRARPYLLKLRGGALGHAPPAARDRGLASPPEDTGARVPPGRPGPAGRQPA